MNKVLLNVVSLNQVALNIVGERKGKGGGGGGKAPEGYEVFVLADGSTLMTADGSRFCVKI